MNQHIICLLAIFSLSLNAYRNSQCFVYKNVIRCHDTTGSRNFDSIFSSEHNPCSDMFQPPIIPFDYYSTNDLPFQLEENLIDVQIDSNNNNVEDVNELQVELPSVVPFCESEFIMDFDEHLLHSTSSKNLSKDKPSIPSDRILLQKEPTFPSSRHNNNNEMERIIEAIMTTSTPGEHVDIYEAMLSRDHASILNIIDRDPKQLERHDFAELDVPANSIPLIVAINLGLPVQLIKLMIDKTSRKQLGRVNFACACALSMAVAKRMPKDIILALLDKSPSEVLTARGDYEDSILMLAILSKTDPAVIVELIARSSSKEVGRMLMLAVDNKVPVPLTQMLIHKAPIESIRLAVKAAMHKNNVPPEYMVLLVEADLPVSDLKGGVHRGYSSWHMLLSHPGDTNFEAIKLLLRRNASIVGLLAVSEDEDGRISFGMASKRVRDEMSKYL